MCCGSKNKKYFAHIASIYNISLDGHEFFHAVLLINQ